MTSMGQELSRLYENSVVVVEPTRLRHKAEYVKHTHTHTHLLGPSKQAGRLLFKGIERVEARSERRACTDSTIPYVSANNARMKRSFWKQIVFFKPPDLSLYCQERHK